MAKQKKYVYILKNEEKHSKMTWLDRTGIREQIYN